MDIDNRPGVGWGWVEVGKWGREKCGTSVILSTLKTKNVFHYSTLYFKKTHNTCAMVKILKSKQQNPL